MKTTSYIDADFQVENKDPFVRGAVMADLYYTPATVHHCGIMKPALFTEAEIQAAINRAKRNREDAPKPLSHSLNYLLRWLQWRIC